MLWKEDGDKIQCYKSSLFSPLGALLMALALRSVDCAQKCCPLGPASSSAQLRALQRTLY